MGVLPVEYLKGPQKNKAECITPAAMTKNVTLVVLIVSQKRKLGQSIHTVSGPSWVILK